MIDYETFRGPASLQAEDVVHVLFCFEKHSNAFAGAFAPIYSHPVNVAARSCPGDFLNQCRLQ